MATKDVNPRKSARVEALRALLGQSQAVAVVDYTGLKVTQATQLRQEIKAAGGQMKVEKNSLFKIAADQKLDLTGLCAFVFAIDDEIAPLRAVADFSRKNSLLTFKAGLWNGRVLTAPEITSLAQTPPREVSLSKLVFLLNWNTSRLVRTLDALASYKH